MAHHLILRPLGQAVKTPPFHGGNTGSNPVGVITYLHNFNQIGYIYYGSVAQSVEQRTENPCVGGSIPS